MTSNPMITKEDLRKIHLYCYEDVQEFLSIHKTLDEEIEKSEAEMDKALVEECLKYVEVVMGEDDDLDEEKLDAKYQEIMARASQKEVVAPKKINKTKTRAVRKFFLVLAATITILFTTLTIAAKICGYDNAWEFVYQKAIEIMKFDDGDRIADEGITLVKDEDMERFSSFEELLEKESLDIIYPQSLPEGLEVTTVRKYSVTENKFTYTIEFKNEKACITIRNYNSIDVETSENMSSCYFNDIEFRIKHHQNGTYQAFYNDAIYEYTINAADYDTLMLLLQNMKGR